MYSFLFSEWKFKQKEDIRQRNGENGSGCWPQPGGGLYGIDVKPWNVKGHLAYSLHRLGILAFAVLAHGLLSCSTSAAAFRKGMSDEVKNKLLEGIREIAEFYIP